MNGTYPSMNGTYLGIIPMIHVYRLGPKEGSSGNPWATLWPNGGLTNIHQPLGIFDTQKTKLRPRGIHLHVYHGLQSALPPAHTELALPN